MSKEKIKETIALAIYHAREGKMTHKELVIKLQSHGIKVLQDTLLKYKNGRINIPSVTLLTIAHILDMDLNQLLRDIKF